MSFISQLNPLDIYICHHEERIFMGPTRALRERYRQRERPSRFSISLLNNSNLTFLYQRISRPPQPPSHTHTYTTYNALAITRTSRSRRARACVRVYMYNIMCAIASWYYIIYVYTLYNIHTAAVPRGPRLCST